MKLGLLSVEGSHVRYKSGDISEILLLLLNVEDRDVVTADH